MPLTLGSSGSSCSGSSKRSSSRGSESALDISCPRGENAVNRGLARRTAGSSAMVAPDVSSAEDEPIVLLRGAGRPRGERLVGSPLVLRRGAGRPRGERLAGSQHARSNTGPVGSTKRPGTALKIDAAKRMRSAGGRAGHLPPTLALAECFQWPRDTWRALRDMLGAANFHQIGRRPWVVSSHFSGLGTLEVAAHMVARAYGVFGSDRLNMSVPVRCEMSPALRSLLCSRGDGCVFGNILDRLQGIQASRLQGGTFGAWRKEILAAPVLPGARCFRHGGVCPVSRVDIDLSGSPCRPWSSANRITRGKNHQDVPALLAWCAVMRHDRPLLAVHENVRGFNASVLEDCLGDVYEIQRVHVDPHMVGFGFMSRPRVYCIMGLRGRVSLSEFPPLFEQATRSLRRNVSSWPDWVWVAEANELLAEENVHRARRGFEPRVGVPSDDWAYLLTENQQNYLRDYLELWRKKHKCEAEAHPGAIFDLGQRPQFQGLRRMDALPSLRRLRSVLWSPGRRRWLIPQELAVAMGWPVYPHLAVASGAPLEPMTPTHATALGNGMHTACLGVVLAVLLAAAQAS